MTKKNSFVKRKKPDGVKKDFVHRSVIKKTLAEKKT